MNKIKCVSIFYTKLQMLKHLSDVASSDTPDFFFDLI